MYEAWDEELSIPVALKTLHLIRDTEEAHKQLKLEGILARSVWHPHVCRIYDLGRHEDGEDAIWFLTMELLRGMTLAELLHEEGRLRLDRARRLGEQMANGIGAAHRAAGRGADQHVGGNHEGGEEQHRAAGPDRVTGDGFEPP